MKVKKISLASLSIDLEAYSSVGIACGAYAYTQAPDFEILLFAYAFGSEPVCCVDLMSGEKLPERVLEALKDPGIIKKAANANFERTCLARHFNEPMPPEQWSCTLVHALYLGLPGKLETVAEVLKIEQGKMVEGKALIRYFCIPCKPTKKNGGRTRNLPHHDLAKWELFKKYNIRDVEVERRVGMSLIHPVPLKEIRLWHLDQAINDRGVMVDNVLVSASINGSAKYQEKLYNKAVDISGLANPGSVAQLKQWIKDVEHINVKSLNKENMASIMGTVVNNKVKSVLELRQEMAKTSVAKYDAMARSMGKDGRVRGLFQFYGANRTGRWAGRQVQVQNLPKNYLDDLDLARELVKKDDFETLEILFDNVANTLSQLIRTAFIPSPGNRFIVADFSAIEARVLSWLAGEQWRMEVFSTHGKIYEASAAAMFKVPLYKIKKGNPEYALRAKGKVAELALGYGGGVNALIKMDALKMGLKETELQPLVDSWRDANPCIVKFWNNVQTAAINCVEEHRDVEVGHGIKFIYTKHCMFIQLPSGRRLAYARPAMEQEKGWKRNLTYEGMNQTSKKWEKAYTYGGKLVENCLSGYSLVLTKAGWSQLRSLKASDLLWDGDNWVPHGGLILKGFQRTIGVSGVRMTPDHKILSDKGWVDASSSEGYSRYQVQLPNRHTIRRVKRKKVSMGCKMRLWNRDFDGIQRVQKREDKVLRVYEIEANFGKNKNPCYVNSSGLQCMEVYGGSVQTRYSPSLEELRWSGNTGMRFMEDLREFLERYDGGLQKRVNVGKGRRKRGLLQRQLHLGDVLSAKSKQKEQYPNTNAMGSYNSFGSVRKIGDRSNDYPISDQSRSTGRPFTCSSGYSEQVYDIMNCGPNNRFTVLGIDGPFIVHNCTQAIARDCLSESMTRIDKAGYEIVMTIHDEVVIDAPKDFGSLENVCEIMGQPIDWAPDLLLRADGFEANYYKKE